MHITFLESC